MSIWRNVYLFLADAIQTLILAGCIFLFIYMFLFRPFRVTGDSMYPTFKNKEYILTNLITMRFGTPQRGDVIVFRAPTDREKDFIKRVIGLPGDTVMLKNGDVYVNNVKLDESSYLKAIKTPPGPFLHDETPINVPPNEYFVMGDNRPYSSDSREWGFLKKSDLIGKSFFVYWPLKNMRIVQKPVYNIP